MPTPLPVTRVPIYRRRVGLRRNALALVAVVPLLLLPSVPAAASVPASAEQAPAGVSGRVLDGTGAVVVGATIVLEPAAGGQRRTTTSDRSGVYTFSDLLPGKYTVTASAESFRPQRVSVDLIGPRPETRDITLEIQPIEGMVTVQGDPIDALRTQVADNYNRNKSVTTVDAETVTQHNPVAGYDALRLLPGVMTAGGSKDRFSVPSHLRGAGAWGHVEQVDDYPAINITPVSAEDGGYTASFSSIIPKLALHDLSLATGGLGVSYGQASGGVVRNGIKRGSAQGPHTTLRLEGMGIGEGVFMGDTGGVYRKLDVYVAAQSVYGEYGDAYATFARPIEGVKLASGLAKVGYKVSADSRAEVLVIAGDETHDYYQLTLDPAQGRNLRRDYHTDKTNYFIATRYDVRPIGNLVFGVGVTHNRFHENRIEDTLDGVDVGLSRRNRPQQATRAFANVDWRTSLSSAVDYTGSGGVEITRDRYRDITTTPLTFEFGEQAAFWRNSLVLARKLTINAGVRATAVDNGFNTTHPVLFDAGLAYELPTRTRLRASYSTGYKLNKAFYLWWGSGQYIQRSPAEGIPPSRTKTIELGAEQSIVRASRSLGLVRLSVYRTNEADLFNFGNTGTGVPFYDDARIRGAEVWTEWKFARFRPFGSFTWLRTERTASTNPAAPNVDLRFTPLPNYAASFGSHLDLSSRLAVALMGYYDDGGINEQAVNDAITITRFERFVKANLAATFKWTDRVNLMLRVENLFNQRDLGYSRSVLNPDGSSQRTVGTHRDPGTIVGGGLQVRF